MDSNKTRIVKVRKNSDGDITDVMVENGTVYSVTDAITMARNHQLENVNVGHARNGRDYLRSNPNGIEDDNLDNLPTF